jgi:hypothetical protein
MSYINKNTPFLEHTQNTTSGITTTHTMQYEEPVSKTLIIPVDPRDATSTIDIDSNHEKQCCVESGLLGGDSDTYVLGRLDDTDILMKCNDQGRLLHLQVNDRATYLFKHFRKSYDFNCVGQVLISGENGQGSTGLSSKVINSVHQILANMPIASVPTQHQTV